jgi:hypothetical protein
VHCCKCNAPILASTCPLLFNIGHGLRGVCNACYDSFNFMAEVTAAMQPKGKFRSTSKGERAWPTERKKDQN